jgi:hypothetical protein
MLVYGPQQCSNIHRGPQKWSDYVVNTIRDLKDTYEMHINFIDMYAEPEPGSFGPAPKDWPQVVKLIRQKLDGNGLNDVKIVAPSLSGVDPSSGGIARLAPLLGDRDAVKSLDMFGFHSYRMSMVKNQRDRLLNAGLTEGFFVTEGGDENCDAGNAVCKGKYYDTRLRANPKYDVSIMGNVLNDINLGTSYWTWFAGTQPIRSIRDARYNSVEGLAILRFGINRIDIYPKYYHLVQFSQAIKVGSKIRLSTSDLGEEDRYIYMEAGYGNRPNIHAVAGQNIDGGWGIALLNMSGSPVSKWGRTVVSNWPAAETQKVTVHVEELALKGDMQFHVYRTIVSDWRNTKKERSIIMRNGNVEVTLQAGDMVTLQTKAATGIIMQ